jgi:hypothetical protein
MNYEGWPDKFELFPRLSRVGRALGSLLVPFHCPVEPFMSEHYRHPLDELPQPVTDWPGQEAA